MILLKMAMFLTSIIVIILLLPQSTTVTATGPGLEKAEEAFNQQLIYQNTWKDLIQQGAIKVDTKAVQDGSHRPFYSVVQNKIGHKLTVKDMFVMLQNWPYLVEKPKQVSFVEIPIAGEKFVFRISQGFYGTAQIYIKNEKGNRAIKYTDFIKTIEKSKNVKAADVAKYMLEVADTKLNGDGKNAQYWKERYQFLEEHTVRNVINEIMIVAQVAEAARPSEKDFKKLKDVITDVTKLIIKERANAWKTQVNDVFEKYNIKFEKFNYDELQNLVEELVKLKQPNADEIKSAILELLGEEKDKIRLADDSGTINKFFTELRETLVHENPSKEFEIFDSEITGKGISGRVPSSDEKFREMLESILNMEKRGVDINLKDFFKSHFPISETTRQGIYQELVEPSLKRSRSSDDSVFDQPRKRPRQLEEEVSTSRGDHDGDIIAFDVKEVLQNDITSDCERKRSTCDIKAKLIENSLEVRENKLTFRTIDENGIERSHHIEIDTSELSTPQYTQEEIELHNELKTKEPSSLEHVSKGLAGYGGIVNILGATQYFMRKEYGKGALSLAQSAHAIGGLTGFNELASGVTKRSFEKVMVYSVEKVGLTESLERLSEAAVKAMGESASRVLKRITGTLPYVGLAFDMYFIAEDIKDLLNPDSSTPLPLKLSHLILDVSITALSLVESAFPEFVPAIEPFSIALVVVRMTLDDFYYDISYELSLVKGKSFGDKVLAFIKGFGEGIADVFTLGLVSQLRRLDAEKKYDQKLLNNLTNPDNYFKVTFQAIGKNGTKVGTVDLTAGVSSQYGGFITMKLNEDNSFTITLPEVPTKNGGTKTVTRTFRYDKPINDIVLGVGEIATPHYTEKEAKLFFFIPVKKVDVISGFDKHKSSRYGVYYGNNKDNDFYTVQGRKRRAHDPSLSAHFSSHSIAQGKRPMCKEPQSVSETTIYLQSYHYDLYGGGGRDRFFLGPQVSSVSGGDGMDLYHLQPDGGKAVIDNFALDEEQDTIFLNVSYESVVCHRNNRDLIMTYCGTHHVQLKNWFIHGNEEYHKHVFILTSDGIGIEAMDTCIPVSIDKSRSTQGETIRLTGKLSQVKQVTGSSYDDVVIGNDMPNTIRGEMGNDQIKGGNGPDLYLIKKGDGVDIINNYASDQKEDTLIFGIDFENINVTRHEKDLILQDSMNNNTVVTTVILKSWFKSSKYQHLALMSRDYVRFTINQEPDGTPKPIPLTIDLGGYTSGVTLDLENPMKSKNFHVNDEIKNDVKVILDTPHDDVLKANTLGNFLSCSGGNDYLQGRGGKDVYVIDTKCTSVTINNYDQYQEFDLILFKCQYIKIKISFHNEDLKMVCLTDSTIVVLKKWLTSENYRHCQMKTSDKITVFLPENNKDLIESEGKAFPVEIESTVDCDGESKHIDLTIPVYQKVERFTAKTDACSFNITGNNLSNFINPGPDNPYGVQYLMGGEGADTYYIGHEYGNLNQINNYAENGETDNLIFDVLFHDVQVIKQNNNAFLTSSSKNDSAGVSLMDYYKSNNYQHILIHTADNFIFVIDEEIPYIKLLMVDYSVSEFSQDISANGTSIRIITGSYTAKNTISSGKDTVKVTGGNKADVINGGTNDESLYGLAGDDAISGGEGIDFIFGGKGDDVIDGGNGDDAIYGGLGADKINGGKGSDYIIFSGANFTGVRVNLRFGTGFGADAEGDSYVSIENIFATEYDDILIANDDDNYIRGYAGNDIIVPGGGDDVLFGGPGNDVYDLTDAYGKKSIMNFATDRLEDFIVLNKSSSDSLCYFYLDEDVQMRISFEKNSGSNLRRVQLDEDFLQISLYYVLSNNTYQHVSIHFIDKKVTFPDDFSITGKQLDSLQQQVTSGHFLSVSDNAQHGSINLIFNFTKLGADNPPDPSVYQLQYSHLTQKEVNYYPISWPKHGGRHVKTMSNVLLGAKHSFIVTLSSCRLIAAVSTPISFITNPSPPNKIIITEIVFDGFKVTWEAPTISTDPNAKKYSYTVKIVSNFTQVVNFEYRLKKVLSFTTYDLLPETTYQVSVTSVIDQTEGPQSAFVIATTKKNNCKNFKYLSCGLKIDRFMKINGILHAKFHCIEGYKLVGSAEVACNDEKRSVPICELITCQLPSVPNANVAIGIGSLSCNKLIAFQKCTYSWTCKYGFELTDYSKKIFSTCTKEGKWNPSITQRCVRKPSCSRMSVPVNGQIHRGFIYIDEEVKYSCNSGYVLKGSSSCQCVRLMGTSAQLSPSCNLPVCKPLPCPSLLPQPNGMYSSRINKVYYTGSTVKLTCKNGYYIRNVADRPQVKTMTCLGGKWDSAQTHCLKSYTVSNIKEQLFKITGMIRYSFSSWSKRPVHKSLYSLACITIGGKRGRFLSVRNNHLSCSRDYKLVNGPSKYTGVLQVSTNEGNKAVCINDRNMALTICAKLGYGKYTSSVAKIRPRSTQLTFQKGINILRKEQRQCTRAVKCRATCSGLNLLYGNDCTETLEGKACYFRCNPGFLLINNAVRRCTAHGWTGKHPFCDGEAWKADIDREARRKHRYSHIALSKHLMDYLKRRYPNVMWAVIVYDPVKGWDAHTMASTNGHWRFRYYGHNIVVARIQGYLTKSKWPKNIQASFKRSLTKHYSRVCVKKIWGICHKKRRYINAEPTVRDTWKKLRKKGLNPVLLHIFRGRTSGCSRLYGNRRGFYVEKLSDGGLATMLILG